MPSGLDKWKDGLFFPVCVLFAEVQALLAVGFVDNRLVINSHVTFGVGLPPAFGASVDESQPVNYLPV